jgi:hypothetical protein
MTIKIKIKNNGCAEVAYADIRGKLIISPGESIVEISSESLPTLVASMERRAPQVFIEVQPEKPSAKPSNVKRKPARKKPDIIDRLDDPEMTESQGDEGIEE